MGQIQGWAEDVEEIAKTAAYIARNASKVSRRVFSDSVSPLRAARYDAGGAKPAGAYSDPTGEAAIDPQVPQAWDWGRIEKLTKAARRAMEAARSEVAKVLPLESDYASDIAERNGVVCANPNCGVRRAGNEPFPDGRCQACYQAWYRSGKKHERSLLAIFKAEQARSLTEPR